MAAQGSEDAAFYNAFKEGAAPAAKRYHEDFVDRLSSRYSIGLALAFSVLYYMARYETDPIVCFTDASLERQHEYYIDSYCWAADKYYLPNGNNSENFEETVDEVAYVQWIQAFFPLACLLFALPGFVWDWIVGNKIHNFSAVVRMTSKGDVLVPNDNPGRVNLIARHIAGITELGWSKAEGYGPFSAAFSAISRLQSGCHVSCAYVAIKVLYIGNAISQVAGLQFLLGFDYLAFGPEYFKLATADKFAGLPQFPRTVTCRVPVLQNDGNVNDHWTECLLPLNSFIEKIFVVYWFWLVAVGAASLAGLVLWVARLSPPAARRFVAGRLLSASENSDVDVSSKDFRRFIHVYLRSDGVLYLRAISRSGGDLVCAEVTSALWNLYCGSKQALGSSETDAVFGESRQLVKATSSSLARLCGISSSSHLR